MERTCPLSRDAKRLATVDLPLPEGPANPTMKVFSRFDDVIILSYSLAENSTISLRPRTYWVAHTSKFLRLIFLTLF